MFGGPNPHVPGDPIYQPITPIFRHLILSFHQPPIFVEQQSVLGVVIARSFFDRIYDGRIALGLSYPINCIKISILYGTSLHRKKDLVDSRCIYLPRNFDYNSIVDAFV